MMRRFAAALAVFVLAAAPVSAAEGIDGVWKTPKGSHAQIYGCGGARCVKLIDGPFKGQVLSSDMADDGSGSWSGSLLNPEDGKTYSGYATLAGGALKLKGCALKIFCKSQTWQRVK